MDKKIYDIIVIGGGIAGLGVAWEGAKKGLSVLLLEQNEICRATSDNSLRIIHGGLRYLQQMNIRRVLDSAREQSDLLKIAPELVKPLWCVMPLNVFGLKSKIPMWFALHFYEMLRCVAGAEKCECGRVVSSKWVDENVEILRGQAPHGAFIWRDAIMPSDRKFAKFIADDAVKLGAELIEHKRVSGFRKSNNGYEVECGDASYECRHLVNTSGAWLQRIASKSLFKPLKWCKAFNIVVSKDLLQKYAVGVSGDLGRVFFMAPREKNEFDEAGTAIGTFYYMYSGDPAQAKVLDSEINESLALVNKACPNLNITRDDVIRIEMGILPATGVNAKGPILYGSEKLARRDNYIEVLSTKYTTFRSQARHVLKACNL